MQIRQHQIKQHSQSFHHPSIRFEIRLHLEAFLTNLYLNTNYTVIYFQISNI